MRAPLPHDGPLGTWPGSTLFSGSSVRVDAHAWQWPEPTLTEARQTACYQIVLPRKGHWTRHVRGVQHLADCMSAVFYNRDEVYRYRHHDPAGVCTYLILAPSALRQILRTIEPRRADQEDLFAVPCRPVDAAIDLEHHALLRALARGDDPLAIEERGLRLIERLLTTTPPPPPQATRPATARTHAEVVEHVQLLLSRNLAAPLTLPHIARQVHSSPYHLSRIFKAHVGMSLHRYRIRLRLRTAFERLTAEPSPNTTELALDLGFASRSHFSDTFRRHYGVPPSSLRGAPSARLLDRG